MQDPEKFVPCGPYRPDMPDFHNPGISGVLNVVPRTRQSYSPMPSFMTSATTPLNGAPLGAFSAADSAGNCGMFAGTTSKLYAAVNATKPNFADASGTATFATPAGNFWCFTEADGYVYASNGFDPIQRIQTAAGGAFSVVNTNAPTARIIAYIQPGFLLCGDITDVTVGVQPQGLRWSALGAPTDFPLIGSADAIAKNSDWQKVSGDHGRLRAIAPDLASCNAALFFETAVFRMIFTGGETIFDIQPVEKLRGTPAPRSLAQKGQIVYGLGPDGFFAFDGTQIVPIGFDKVDRTFFKDVDPNYLSGVTGAADPLSGLIFWCYAGAGNTGGVPNRILVYNSLVGEWGFINAPGGNNLFIGRAFGTSLDAIDALGYSLDTLPYSLDSPILAGGRIVLAGFDSAFNLGYFSGPNMAFSVETSETQLIPGRKARVKAVRAAVEGDVVTAALACRDTLQGTISYPAADSAQGADGRCPVRGEGRYHRARLSALAGNLVKHIQGAELTYSLAGRR